MTSMHILGIDVAIDNSLDAVAEIGMEIDIDS